MRSEMISSWATLMAPGAFHGVIHTAASGADAAFSATGLHAGAWFQS